MCTLLSGPSPSDLFGLVGPARAQGPADIAPGIVRTHKLYRPVKACTQDRAEGIQWVKKKKPKKRPSIVKNIFIYRVDFGNFLKTPGIQEGNILY